MIELFVIISWIAGPLLVGFLIALATKNIKEQNDE